MIRRSHIARGPECCERDPHTKHYSRPAVLPTQREPLTLGISPRMSADTSSSVVLGASVDMNRGRYGERGLCFSTADGRIAKENHRKKRLWSLHMIGVRPEASFVNQRLFEGPCRMDSLIDMAAIRIFVSSLFRC